MNCSLLIRLFLMTATLVTASLGLVGVSAQASPALSNAVVYAHIANAGQIVALPDRQLLIADIGNLDRTGGQVLITNFAGDLIWRYAGTLDIPHSAYPMTNGDILIADTGDNRVIEVNRASQIVWDTDNLGNGHGVLGEGTMSDGKTLAYPNDAKPLANSDVMISCRLQDRVIIINRNGRIVRQISGFLHGQHNPTPASNGNIYIADSGADRILEVNSKNRIDWVFGGQQNGSDILNWPRDAVPMPDGNTLVTDSDHNRLIEITHSKQIVRQWTNLARPYAATPLPNGDILVGDGSGYGVIELSHQDKIVWKLNHASTGGPHGHASTRVRNGSFEHTIPGSQTILAYWGRNDALAYNVPPGRRAIMVRDGHVHHKGHYSARITYHGDSNGLFFGQIVHVLAGHQYRFSGWIKTHNVSTCYPCIYGTQDPRGHTAEFELTYNSSSGTPPAAPALPQHTGTIGWTKDELEFTVPANVQSIGIQCELRGQGTVWFDDVWLQKLN